MKIFSIIFLITFSAKIFAFNPYTASITSYSETTGLDSNDTPLPGSDWVVGYSSAYSNDCDDFNLPTGLYYNSNVTMRDSAFYKSVLQSDITDYIDSNKTCAIDASSPLDPTNQAIWSDLGLVRDQSFGTKTINCGTTSCSGVVINKTYSDKYIDTINPTIGTNANKASDFEFFIYNTDNVSVNLSNGIAGIGGKADLIVPSSEIKYCYQKRDVTTDGAGSSYASTPLLDLKIINWKTIIQGPNQPNSDLVGSTNGKVYIIKGLDDSQLNFLYQDNILSEF